MRIIVNCTGGGSHSMMVMEQTTVMDVKKHVEKKEGVAVGQQLLLFAGQVLCPDTALLLEDLGLDRFSLAHEVVVYMQRQLSEPVLVYLCQPGTAPCQLQPEFVEASSTLSNIMALLKQRGLSSRPFPTTAAATGAAGPAASSEHGSARTSTDIGRSSNSSGNGGGGSSSSGGVAARSAILPSCIVVKRQDGSCSSGVRVTEACTMSELQATIQHVEGSVPTHLSFNQAPDGCLHVVWGPSADSCSNSHTLYSRSSMPQTTMLVKGSSSCVPLTAVIREQAVMP